jgi:hypothetical protein
MKSFGCGAVPVFLLAVIATFLQQLLCFKIHEINPEVVIQATQERVVSTTSDFIHHFAASFFSFSFFPSLLGDHNG